MQITRLALKPLRIPFKTSFKHHSAERKVTQSVLVVVETDSGAIGVGEGCPREYVTGESLQSCQEFFSTWSGELRAEIRSITDLRNWVELHRNLIDDHPAAWCAIELALLDALARDAEQTVEELLRQPTVTGPFTYSAVIGDGDADRVATQITRYASLGFTDFKLKISGDVTQDADRFRLLEQIVPTARLRLDGNNLWQCADEVAYYLDRLDIHPFALEEPLQVMDFTGMEKLARTAAVHIVVDESALNPKQIPALRSNADVYIVNIRISKMGGILRSLSMADAAITCGLPLIVGAHVGETSVLTRAAMTIASAYAPHLLAMEGAFGTHLLQADIVRPSLVFAAAGRLDFRNLLIKEEHGFQLAYQLPEGGWTS